MEKTYIGGEKLELLERENIELKYYVLTQKYYCEEQNRTIDTYGIEIQSVNQEQEEVNKIENVTINKEKAFLIAETLRKNIVMPIHLKDVIEDLI